MDRGILRLLLKMSIVKTLFFNFHYFGANGWHMPVLISRNVSLKSVGGGVIVESYKIGNVKIGFDNIGIGDGRHQRGTLQILGSVVIGEGVNISTGVKICCGENGHLVLNKKTSININSEIICMDNIELGENAMVSWDVLIIDSDFHQIVEDGIRKPITAPIIIGSNVWIGCRSVVLKGSTVPNGCIIAANCTVSNSFNKKNVIIVGKRIIAENVSWNR